MRNLIYTCCFYQVEYVQIVLNFINSVQPYLNENTDLLVYTTSHFKELITNTLPGVPIKFFEKNFYKTMNQARISKMDIFDYPEIDNYSKILYLDADSHVIAPLEPIFNAIQDDVVYAVGEGTILCEAEYWGRSLFLRDNADTTDREGLGAYALGFKNLPELKKLFIKIKQAFYLDMYQNKLRFYDQPFLNFYLISGNVCDTQTFKQYIKARPTGEDAIKSNTIVAHFSGCPGHADVKMELINEFKSQLPSPRETPRETPNETKVSQSVESEFNKKQIIDALTKIKALIASIETLI
jgi:hypothetical protein